MKTAYPLFCVLLCLGCTSEPEGVDTGALLSDPAHPHWGHDHEDTDQKQGRVQCADRWVVDAPNAGLQSVPFSGAGGRCLGRAQSGAVELGNRIRNRFGHLMNLRIDGRGIQIYNCRQVRGGRSMSLHSEGRAIDIFIPTLGGRADNSKGDLIANWLVENSDDIGVMAIIWDRTRWRADSNQSRCYQGTHAHYDHIHVELSWAAARQETPFFNRPDPTPMMSEEPPVNPSESDSQEASPPPADMRPEPAPQPEVGATPAEPPSRRTWLGSPCLNDTQCDFTVEGYSPICLVNQNSATHLGICTLSCEGFCPDQRGSPTTFCANGDAFGYSGGLCVAEASSQNGYCQDWVGLELREATRHVGSSRAAPRNSEICMPDWRPSPVPPPSEERIDEDWPADQVGLCADPALEPTDHDHPCPGVENNTWRCGCSIRYEAPVSQVCRGGYWVNYELNPRDCARCDGDYTRGCEP